jgi:hypothetical protein
MPLTQQNVCYNSIQDDNQSVCKIMYLKHILLLISFININFNNTVKYSILINKNKTEWLRAVRKS